MHLALLLTVNSSKPVIACPPYSETFNGIDIFSSLRVPSGIGSVVTIEPEGAAIATAKIFGSRRCSRRKLSKIIKLQRKKSLKKLTNQ